MLIPLGAVSTTREMPCICPKGQCVAIALSYSMAALSPGLCLGECTFTHSTLGSWSQSAGKLVSLSRVLDQVSRTSWGASAGRFPLRGLLASVLSTCSRWFMAIFHLFIISSSVAGVLSRDITQSFLNFQIR
jgi:hypothetical protein